MSLAELILDEKKPYLNARVNDLTVDGDLIIAGNVEFEGNVQVDQNLTVLGTTTVKTLTQDGGTTNLLDTTTDALTVEGHFYSKVATGINVGTILVPTGNTAITAAQLIGGVIIQNTDAGEMGLDLALPNAADVSALLSPAERSIGNTFFMYLLLTTNHSGSIAFTPGTNFTVSGGASAGFAQTTVYDVVLPCRITAVTPTFTMELLT